MGSPAEKPLRGATLTALVDTVEVHARGASQAQIQRIGDILDQCWPLLDFSTGGSGSMLDRVEFIVSEAMTTASTPVDVGGDYEPTSPLDAINHETGLALDEAEFARDFSHRWVQEIRNLAATNDAIDGLANQLAHDETQRMIQQQSKRATLPAQLGVEFVEYRNSRLSTGTLMDDLVIGFVNRGDRTAAQVTFRIVASAAYCGESFDADSKKVGEATSILPGDDTAFRVVDELGRRWAAFRGAIELALMGFDDGIVGNEPLEISITPTFRDSGTTQFQTGPTARARLKWSRDDGRFALSYLTQVLDAPNPPT